jgi:putative inorganic carbon (HCO3(-)) transporter
MNILGKEQDFFKKILVSWLGVFYFLIPLCFCFYTYDSAQVKITVFYLGSCGAFFIWLSSLLYKSENIFTKKNFLVFLPILCYALYIALSYFFKPYRLGRIDFFIREIFCLALFFIFCFELNEENFKTLLKYFFASAWLVFIYGILQIFNLDFLPWKNFFGRRVFSTFANPNLLGSYALFIAILSFFSYLINDKKSLIILCCLALINLVFTQSKGALLAFALTAFLGSIGYCIIFISNHKNKRKKGIALILLLAVIAGGLIANFSIKRQDSFSFRLSTWRSTWDMIKASPITGTGADSFEIVYPAYKRPEIFYIEQKHNIASQHAENYYLEQWATLGSLGFGLFLWVLFYLLKQDLFKLKNFAQENRKKALFLMGVSLAAASIYIHNAVDVSIYFVSTSSFLIFFNGVIFNLAFGPFETKKIQDKKSTKLFKPVLFLAIAALTVIWVYIYKIFWQDFLLAGQHSFLQIFYCLGFLIISCAILFVFIKLMLKAKRAVVCFCFILAGILNYLVFSHFMSGVYYSRATILAENKRFEALTFYTKAINANPFSFMPRHFRGLMFSNRFILAEKRDASVGDKQKPSNDFERALRDFNITKKLVPNAALLHYNIGSLYLKYALTKEPSQREYFYFQAEENFRYALLLDPVNENIYFQLANIELSRGNKDKAVFWIEEYLKGPKEVNNPAFLKFHKENKKANQVLQQLKRG